MAGTYRRNQRNLTAPRYRQHEDNLRVCKIQKLDVLALCEVLDLYNI